MLFVLVNFSTSQRRFAVEMLLKSLMGCKEEGSSSTKYVDWISVMLILRIVWSVQVSFVSARRSFDPLKILKL